jgi:hypothetical protein
VVSLHEFPDGHDSSIEVSQTHLAFVCEDREIIFCVKVSKSDDPVSMGGRLIPASRFDFSGDWQASIWFDEDKKLLKMHYKAEGRDIVVALDQN